MILFFEPVFKERLWGGQKLHTIFQYDVPFERTGECWGISAHPNGESIVRDGEFAGWSLKQLWDDQRVLFGGKEGKDFPILVKLIDAQEDLSIQVHPDDAYAKPLGSFGKTECWYILDAEKKARMAIGHNAETQDEFRNYVNEELFEELVQYFPIKKGDYFFIEAGTLHAICAGTLLLEIQQSSDITYRFYDYDRLENKKPRQLHLKEALEVVKIPDKQVNRKHDHRYFSFEIIENFGAYRTAHQHGDFLIGLEGSGALDQQTFKKGDFAFVSSQTSYTVSGFMKYARVTIT